MGIKVSYTLCNKVHVILYFRVTLVLNLNIISVMCHLWVLSSALSFVFSRLTS